VQSTEAQEGQRKSKGRNQHKIGAREVHKKVDDQNRERKKQQPTINDNGNGAAMVETWKKESLGESKKVMQKHN
jgi:hypothetical protein